MNSTKLAHPLDELIPDPTGRTPLCDETEFAELMSELVTESAPRLFAVVQEYGERVDAVIAAWGMAFEEHAVVANTSGELLMCLNRPENAVRRFNRGNHVRAHLVWVAPASAAE